MRTEYASRVEAIADGTQEWLSNRGLPILENFRREGVKIPMGHTVQELIARSI